MKVRRLNGFNAIAPVYDLLAKLVFGRSIRTSQLPFLGLIQDGSTVLIIGGGTGWILRDIFRLRPNCIIYYVEASSTMIQRAKTHGAFKNITFIHGTEDDIPFGLKADTVIANFYLDLFHHESVAEIVKKLKNSSSENSQWLVTDFQSQGKLWQRVLLKSMYWFFRTASKIEASTLPNWKVCLEAQGLTEVNSQTYYKGFMRSAVFKFTTAP